MQRITIGRYQNLPVVGALIKGLGYAGWIEGARDDGTEWVMFIDDVGSPQVFWERRDQDDGVVGDPIELSVGRPGLEPGIHD